VLYNYGEHGRELITVDVAVQLLRDLARGVEHAATLADPGAVRPGGETVYPTRTPYIVRRTPYIVRTLELGPRSLHLKP
jgi:hypothetical protein